MKYNLSYSTKLSHGYIPEQIAWLDLHLLTSTPSINYTSGSFKDGHRKIDNWNADNNLVILDIDNGLTLNVATQILLSNGLKSLIVTTKSHRIEKNGEVCDRYRIILPMQSEFSMSTGEYREYFIEICKLFLNAVDPATKDPARFYYANPEQQHWYIDGDTVLDWYFFKPTQKPVATNNNNNKTTPNGLIKWGVENIKQGNRNNGLFWVYNRCIEEGYDAEAVITQINSNLSNPLSEIEVKKLLRKV